MVITDRKYKAYYISYNSIYWLKTIPFGFYYSENGWDRCFRTNNSCYFYFICG